MPGGMAQQVRRFAKRMRGAAADGWTFFGLKGSAGA
jgi:hypothetical protein